MCCMQHSITRYLGTYLQAPALLRVDLPQARVLLCFSFGARGFPRFCSTYRLCQYCSFFHSIRELPQRSPPYEYPSQRRCTLTSAWRSTSPPLARPDTLHWAIIAPGHGVYWIARLSGMVDTTRAPFPLETGLEASQPLRHCSSPE